jgi:hypothetical protein
LTEPRNEERRTTFLRLLILLIILASFLVYAVLSQSAEAPPGPVPSVVTDVGLLITVILCVSISFWLTFAGNEAQGWKRGAWLFVGLICGAAWFLLLTLLAGLGAAGSSGWLDANGYTATIYNMSMAVWFMFGIAIILGVAAFLALVLILDSLEVAEAQARLQKK